MKGNEFRKRRMRKSLNENKETGFVKKLTRMIMEKRKTKGN